MTPWAAKWAACWLEPHWRSMVVPGTSSGQPAASTALRPTLTACSPTCMTQPMTTSSTMPGSMPVRSISAVSVSAARSTGCQSLSLPLRRPSGVRIASTITAVFIETSFRANRVGQACSPPPVVEKSERRLGEQPLEDDEVGVRDLDREARLDDPPVRDVGLAPRGATGRGEGHGHRAPVTLDRLERSLDVVVLGHPRQPARQAGDDLPELGRQ